VKAWAVVENGKPLQEIDLPTPEPEGSQVLLEVTHCGVCHTDVHLWEGYFNLGASRRMRLDNRGVGLPLAMGHEIVGRVAKLGPLAAGAQIGDVRIVYPWIGCGRCVRCTAGEANLCAVENRSLGVFEHGGYASYVCVEAANLVDPGDLDPAFASTLACSGLTAYSAVRKALPGRPDEPFVVIGCGGLGLTAITLLKVLGHRAIVAVDVSAAQLQAAKAAGASAAVLAGDVASGAAIARQAGGAILNVIDFVGSPATVGLAVSLLAKGGHLVVVGLFGGEWAVAIPIIPLRALAIEGAYAGSLPQLRELVALAQSSGLPSIAITCKHKSQTSAVLSELKSGRVAGRVVLTP
jgi:alcohol dehydrogenase, propanol-preferring